MAMTAAARKARQADKLTQEQYQTIRADDARRIGELTHQDGAQLERAEAIIRVAHGAMVRKQAELIEAGNVSPPLLRAELQARKRQELAELEAILANAEAMERAERRDVFHHQIQADLVQRWGVRK